jgi:hypothetical protein
MHGHIRVGSRSCAAPRYSIHWSHRCSVVTRENVIAYAHALRETNSNATIIGICSALRSALRIMHPAADFGWITSPGGQSLASAPPVAPRSAPAFHSKVLYRWGLSMMRKALLTSSPDARRRDYRNGLLIALFAARAPRVRSMASLRLGVSVIRSGDTWRLIFESDDVKTGRRIAYDAPASLRTPSNATSPSNERSCWREKPTIGSG